MATAENDLESEATVNIVLLLMG